VSGTSTASGADQFTYIPNPLVTSISPTSGSTAGGTAVTITGTNLLNTSAVIFGGTPAASFTVNSSTSITATTAAHAAGSASITVTTPGGSSAGTQYTYIAPVTATQTVASTQLTQNRAATSFTPVTGGGGTAPYTYSVSPTLPAGLNFSTSGAITGTPSATSTATIYTVTVTDATSATATNSFTLTVNPAVTATQSVAAKILTQNHASPAFTPVTGGGGTGALAYSISPSLTPGLNLSPTTGAITGAASSPGGGVTYTVTVTDTNGATASNTFQMAVNTPVVATQSVATTALTQGRSAGSFTPVTAAGGLAPLAFSISPPLPAGLSLSPSLGAISGTPTVTSSATTYTVTATDANGATGNSTFTLIINGAVTATQTVASTTLTQSHAVTSFTPVTGSGGTSPLAYSVSPSLPTGLNLSPTTGAITGTPSVTSAATTYTVTVTDANGANAANTFSLTVNGALTAAQAIASKTLTVNVAAAPFTPVTGAGGTGSLTYSVSPPLPTGLAILPSTGAITGTPTVTSSATSYTVTVTDANAATATASFSLTVNPPAPSLGSVAPASGPTAGGTSVTITGTNFTGATSVTFASTAAASFIVNSATTITALTPAHAAGAVNVVVTTPGGPGTGTNAYTFVTALNLSSTPSANTHIGQNYSQANTTSGGTTPYAYTISAGSLPAGTTLNAATGLVSGTLTTAGNFSYTVKVTDSSPVPQTTTQTVSGSITSGVTTTSVSSSLNPSQVGQSVTFKATVTGSGSPTGTVTFMDGGSAIGTGTLAGGIAAFSTSALTLGSHTITASYAGSAGFSSSTSVALMQVVNVPADSVKLRAMQVMATVVVAQYSGQAISGAVDSAIADGFANGGNFMSPSGDGMHFNFTSDPDAQAAANAQSTVSDRSNGTFRPDGSNSTGATSLNGNSGAANSYARNQPPSRIDDAFASIDRNAMATKAPPRVTAPREWMLWGEVRASGIDRWSSAANPMTQTTTPTLAPLYGSQVNALIGLTRKFNSSFLAGVFGGYETFDYRSDALEGRLKGEGWTAGSYLGWKLTPDIRLTTAAAYSGITYVGTAGTATGNFDGDRLLLSGALTGNYHIQRFEIEPSATIYALWEHENAYTDSLGTQQADRTFFTGRASGGIKLAYPIASTSTMTLAPYLGLYADYYFNGDDAATLTVPGSVALASTPILEGWSARFTGGLTTRFANGSAMAFGAELGGLGSSTQIWTFRGRGSIPF
jgi:hypothetical protein